VRFAHPPLLPVAAIFAGLVVLSSAPASWWDDQGYGSTHAQAASFVDTNGRSTIDGAERIATNKGIAVRLGPANDVVFIFDTELLRATGAWEGGSPTPAEHLVDDAFPSTPSPPHDSSFYFGTRVNIPGWGIGDNFIDPRSPSGRPRQTGSKPFAGVPFGPLPREWAKYRGMYLHDDRVVFAYTVGPAALLESPALENRGLLTRTFNVLTPGDASSLSVADAPEGGAPRLENGMVEFVADPSRAGSRTIIGVRNVPPGGKLVVDGTRITLKLPPFAAGQKFKVIYARGTTTDSNDLRDAIKAAAEPEDLQSFTHGGAAQWPQTVKTKVTPRANDGGSPYVVDDLVVPLDNHDTPVDICGIDFFKDGRMAFCTRSGDVWVGKGIDGKPETMEWKRFAAGLDHPAGLRIVDDQIYVLGRDQITRLHDLNSDGEADFYECFNNDLQVSPSVDDPISGLVTDSNGNFYFSQGAPEPHQRPVGGSRPDHRGCLLRVSGSGQKFDVFASSGDWHGGIGIGVGPNDEMSIGMVQDDHEGITDIRFVNEDEIMDTPEPLEGSMAPGGHSSPLCWIPHGWGPGGGPQIWVPDDRWGPLQGAMLYLTNNGSIFGVLQESVGETRQGGTFQFPLKLDETVHCARFSPIDGQLYVAGRARREYDDAAIQRVRYAGKPVTLPNALKINSQGITISFTNPVEMSSLNNPKNYSVEQGNYRWSASHLKEYQLSDSKQEGHDVVEIKAVLVAPDHKSVFLEIPGLRPVMQMKIQMKLKGAKGEPIPGEIDNTINVVPKGEGPKWINFGVGSQL
jgi:hypothetical protein